MSTTTSNPENGTDDELPAGWTETAENRWDHDDGSIVRIRRDFPVRSAAACNRGERVDADGELHVLAHSEPLPSEAEPIHRGGTLDDARAAALEHVREHPEGC